MNIRFHTLPSLLSDMEKKNWVIDAFQFTYNTIPCYCLFTLYDTNEKKPSDNAKLKLDFIHKNNTDECIKAYADFQEVKFKSVSEFCNFFNIKGNGNYRDLFINFADFFSTVLPKEITKNKPRTEEILIARRLEPDNPNAIYCFDIRRNGHDENGNNNVRSVRNSQKAEMFCSDLYERFKSDTNLSFFFSENPSDEVKLEEILRRFSERY
ncbi:MAG: hypothetical protein E7060_01445 [Treponema bryantii]|nr:hypothetical protein [Treponema bryantii]